MLKKIAAGLSGVKAGKTAMVAIVLLGVLAGYNTTFTYMRSCSAQPLPVVSAPPVIGGNCICCSPYSCPQPCDSSGTADDIQQDLVDDLETLLEDMSEEVEGAGINGATSGIAYAVDTLTMTILNRMNQVELDVISWWQSMWYYNLKPAMQQQTRQLNTANVDQMRAFQGSMDAIEQTKTVTQQQENEIKADKTFTPSEQVCVGATNAGGLGRATEFAKGVRKSLEGASRARGLNKKNTPAASGATVTEKQRHDDYEAIFCDPNGGLNACGGDPKYYNADTQVTNRIYNKLTVDMDADPKAAVAVEAIQDNMMGSTSAETITLDALDTAEGQETFMKRRSFLARHAAASSVPKLIFGWRSPGSGMAPWVTQLRQDAGIVSPDAISKNPSYKEVVHAMTVDRFNSTDYANKMISTQADLEKEKLMLNAFYLMQLRDYFELLERQALALVVQVSVLTDNVKIPEFQSVRPVK